MLQIDDNYLIETLRKACSLDPASVKEAEAKIQDLEIRSGYSYKLLVINHCLNLLDEEKPLKFRFFIIDNHHKLLV